MSNTVSGADLHQQSATSYEAENDAHEQELIQQSHYDKKGDSHGGQSQLLLSVL